MSLKTELDAFAAKLLRDYEPDNAVDVFKAVSAYYIGTRRVDKRQDGDGEAGTFGSIVNGIVASAPTPKKKAVHQ